MILVDTSVWIDHLRKGDDLLVSLLNSAQVSTHRIIIGELACGNLRNRDIFLTLIQQIPELKPAMHEEVVYFIESNRLMGRGVGYIDIHLLASLTLNKHTFLWTRDKRLGVLADELGLAYHEPVT